MIISKKALISRINRALRKENEALRVGRSERAWFELGYHIVDVPLNIVIATHVDVEELGRELGVLRAHEEVRRES